MGWWPKPEYGFMAYASPLPSFAAMAVPLMFLCDWLNRPAFEEHSQDILHRLDLVDISSYYSRSPSSGFWILEYGDKFIGLIALDASLDSLSNESVTSSVADSRRLTKDRLSKKGTSSTATIRHFYVDEPYRAAGMQNDLLIHAVKHAFEADKTVQNIRAVATPLKAYISTLLRQRGFQLGELTVKVGILKWQNSIRVLSRKTWQSSSTERDA
ncbi:hypothetical protein AcV7_000586 [Taiwanofungus camphoratus]|nr:hypothetical protein AcW2_000939 [Antrodia cinnamomea]KAI0961502.1 hypothetical protein AcV7_000586 [Antrodia cinnamomea]